MVALRTYKLNRDLQPILPREYFRSGDSFRHNQGLSNPLQATSDTPYYCRIY